MESNSAQPGQTVTPSASPPNGPAVPQPPVQASSAAPTPPQDPKPSETPDPTPPPEPQPQAPAPEPAPSPDELPDRPPFEASAMNEVDEDDGEADGVEPITWTASEFIAHAKSFRWYVLLLVAAAVFAAGVYLVTRDYVSVGVVLVAAVIFAYYAGHQPRELQYQLDDAGLTIGQKHIPYGAFRSFSVLPEGAFSSIVFMPLRRFAVPTTIYYAPQDEEKIVGLLGGYLPLEEGGHDAVDRLMHRIHF